MAAKIHMTELEISDMNLGGCLGCGEVQAAEPDAQAIDCECCDRPMVFGIEHLLLNGHVVVEDE